MELRAGLTVVREWQEEDAEALAAIANDRQVWLGLRDAFPNPYSIDDARAFIAKAAGHSPRSYFAITVDGKLAGGIGYTQLSDVERIGAEVGYWLGCEFWGRGIATEALRLMTRHAFRTNPVLRRLFALPYASNPASARVLEKAGYRLEGTLRQSAIKNGHVLDQWMYAILRHQVQGSATDSGGA